MRQVSLLVETAHRKPAGAAAPISIPAFGGVIDNGNHLVLSGNRAVNEYLARIGSGRDALTGPPRAEFPFRRLAEWRRFALDLAAQ